MPCIWTPFCCTTEHSLSAGCAYDTASISKPIGQNNQVSAATGCVEVHTGMPASDPVRRRRFQACPDQLEAAGHAGAMKLFDVVAPPLHQITGTTLLDNGRFRWVA